MAASNLPITESGVPTHFNRNEQVGTQSGKPIISQVVLAGVHKRAYKGVQSLVLTSTAQALTIPAGSPAVFADVYCEEVTTGFARYWHGATPTATVGKRLYNHEEIQSASPADILAIIGSGAPVLRCEFYTNE